MRRDATDAPADVDASQTHGNMVPAEVRQGEPIAAVLTIYGGPDGIVNQPLRVWRLSPFGIELACRSRLLLDGSQELALVITLGSQTLTYERVEWVGWSSETDYEILHLRFAKAPERAAGERSRLATRWTTNLHVTPTGVAANPARFNDMIHFRVKDLSADGLQFATSMRNKHLLQGLALNSTVHLPGQGSIAIDLQILHSRIVSDIGRGDHLAVGARMQGLNALELAKLGQYLLEFSQDDGASLWTLDRSGLPIRSLSSALTFGRAQTPEDYRDVLHLRRDSYGAAGKVSADAPIEEMSDAFDRRGRILVARHHGRIVASIRLLFSNRKEELEHSTDTDLPDDFPPAHEMLEVSRLCVMDGYRGDDLMVGLMRHAFMVALQTRRRWILGSSTARLRPAYEKVGCVFPGVKYRIPSLNNVEHFVFLADTLSLAAGDGVSPAIWSFFVPNVLSQLDFNPFAKAGAASRLRVGLYKSIHPASKFFTDRVRAMRWRRRRG